MSTGEKRERPPMPPLAVRVQVAERQVRSAGGVWKRDLHAAWPLAKRLFTLLEFLFPDGAEVALDHDPALILRPYNPRIKDVAKRYTPHAHDPAALIYREKADHGQKTTGRRPGAERTITTKGSDIGLKTKFARLERKKATGSPRNRKGGRLKSKFGSRPFPKGRGFRKP